MFEDVRENITNGIYYQKMLKKKAWSPMFFWLSMFIIVMVSVILIPVGILLLIMYYYFVPEYEMEPQILIGETIDYTDHRERGFGGFLGWSVVGGIGLLVMLGAVIGVSVIVARR